MTLTSQTDVGPSLQALPAAVVFANQLLVTQESAVPANSDSMDEKIKLIEARAKSMTSILEQIEGFSHGGINE
jgi:hypothetical protein